MAHSKHFSSVIHLLGIAQVKMHYCKQKPGQIVMSPPTGRVAHLVFTVGEYADQVAWNAAWSAKGLIDSMRWHGCMDEEKFAHINGAAITHEAMAGDLVQIMKVFPNTLPYDLMPAKIQRLYNEKFDE